MSRVKRSSCSYGLPYLVTLPVAHPAGKLYIWVTWTPNLALFAALSAPFAPMLDGSEIRTTDEGIWSNRWYHYRGMLCYYRFTTGVSTLAHPPAPRDPAQILVTLPQARLKNFGSNPAHPMSDYDVPASCAIRWSGTRDSLGQSLTITATFLELPI
jgi:hypothetical protein